MKPSNPYWAVAMWSAMFLALAPSLCAQQAPAPRPTGVPQDWSDRRIIFSRDALAQHPDLIYREPRVLYQAMQRWQAPNSDVFRGVDPRPTPAEASGQRRDWSQALASRIAPNMSPAKYSFDPGAPPSCSGDYVLFGLAVAETAGASGTGVHPNLVALNNLYAGTGGLCGAAPTVLFAYNITTATGGKIVTSPILSENGNKVAFVESLGTSAIFHVLTWTANQGTLTAAAAPTMTSLTFSATATSTTSSPWIDYASDIVYLGADNGQVYKITGVFKGTPTIATGVWPVTVSTGFHLTSPVLDETLGVLMVGSTNGSLYQINISTGAVATLVIGKSGGTNPGLLATPTVDVTNGTTFVVSANDGTSGVLVEVDTAAMTQLSKARIGIAAAFSPAPTPPISLYEPAFNNDYFNNPRTGVVRLCGTGASDNTPWQYAFGFTGRTLRTSALFSKQLLTSTAARCTGWTEFFNPNVGTGGTDFFFFGLTQDCTGTGTSGCVAELSGNTAPTATAAVSGGPSGIVVDNYATAGQASSIYLMANKFDAAYKFTQNGLQ